MCVRFCLGLRGETLALAMGSDMALGYGSGINDDETRLGLEGIVQAQERSDVKC